MSKGNQINLGESVTIDTDEVQYSEKRDGDAPKFSGTEKKAQTRVLFKSGDERILRGDAKAAFDEWVAGDREPHRVTMVKYQYVTKCVHCAREELTYEVEREAEAERQRCGNSEWWRAVTHDDPLMPSLTRCMNARGQVGPVWGEECWCSTWEPDAKMRKGREELRVTSEKEGKQTRCVPDLPKQCESCRSFFRIEGKPDCYKGFPEERPECWWCGGEEEDLLTHHLTAMAYKRGVRAGRRETPSCQTCIHHDWKIGPCQSLVGPDAFPECYEALGPKEPVVDCKLCVDYNPATDHCTQLYTDQSKGHPECFREREGAEGADAVERLCYTCDREDDKPGCCAEPFKPRPYPDCYKKRDEHEEPKELCRTCRKHNEKHGWCMDSSMVYPECYRERKTKVDKPLCTTCACYEAESGHCTEFAGNHYPECWVAAEPKIKCASCRHYSGPPSYYCVPGRGWERPGCYEKGNRKALRAARKAAEAKAKEEQAAEAKVLLLSRIWECGKCGEVLATDLDGKPANMTDPQGGEIVVNGEVRIQVDGILSITCWQCRTVNLWPEELRERVKA